MSGPRHHARELLESQLSGWGPKLLPPYDALIRAARGALAGDPKAAETLLRVFTEP